MKKQIEEMIRRGSEVLELSPDLVLKARPNLGLAEVSVRERLLELAKDETLSPTKVFKRAQHFTRYWFNEGIARELALATRALAVIRREYGIDVLLCVIHGGHPMVEKENTCVNKNRAREIVFPTERDENNFDDRHWFCRPEQGCKIIGEDCFAERVYPTPAFFCGIEKWGQRRCTVQCEECNID